MAVSERHPQIPPPKKNPGGPTLQIGLKRKGREFAKKGSDVYPKP
jgi:hypothetical protein